MITAARYRALCDIDHERQRQVALGKSDAHPTIWWFPILSYQLGLIAQQLSLAVLEQGSLATRPGSEPVEIDQKTLYLGLTRLCAVGLGWMEQIHEGGGAV